ncbi:MAG: nucleotide exchange factor GrpE [Gammaproteobacteria bacterium]|nr:nucleotide exchange factor GrpE [Gammaproteobacteria bacterium]NND53525.1 nucleotide exchange factor GrpE [Gammaproteobacteria bacterium]
MTSENDDRKQTRIDVTDDDGNGADPQEHVETAVLPEDELADAVAAADGPEQQDGEAPEDALTLARAEAEENWNKYLRIVAELENVRKRNARELEKARNYGVEGLATELLTVADSLEMALATGTDAPAESLIEGGRNTLKQLQKAMENYGVTEIFPEGEPFDPELHEAMTMQPSETAEPNTVLTVVQRGYQLKGRLLRPARVIVAKEP